MRVEICKMRWSHKLMLCKNCSLLKAKVKVFVGWSSDRHLTDITVTQ